MKIQLKILKELIFDLVFMIRDDENTFYYFGFHFLFLGIYFWNWVDISKFTFSVYIKIPFTKRMLAFEKYIK